MSRLAAGDHQEENTLQEIAKHLRQSVLRAAVVALPENVQRVSAGIERFLKANTSSVSASHQVM